MSTVYGIDPLERLNAPAYLGRTQMLGYDPRARRGGNVYQPRRATIASDQASEPTTGAGAAYRALSRRPAVAGPDRSGGGYYSGNWNTGVGAAAPAAAGGGGGTAATPGPDLEINAQEYQPLVGLQNEYSQYLKDFEPATDRGAIRLGQDIRDLNSGQAAERAAGYAARGLRGAGSGDASTLLENQASADTTRAAGRAMSDYREGRARAKGEAIRGGLGVMGAPAELALREKSFGEQVAVNQANLRLNQAETTWQQYLALLHENRSSPIYSEPTAPLTGGGGGFSQEMPGNVVPGGGFVGSIGIGGGNQAYRPSNRPGRSIFG